MGKIDTEMKQREDWLGADGDLFFVYYKRISTTNLKFERLKISVKSR